MDRFIKNLINNINNNNSIFLQYYIMNIVEAYIKFKGQLVIVISGINGCGKSEVANDIASDMELDFVDQFDFFKENYNKKTELINNIKIINWDTDDAIDWDKFNNRVNEEKSNGIMVVGSSFPTDKLKFDIDFHLHVSLSKKVCFEKRKGFLEKHRDKYPEDVSDNELLKFNKFTFPYYLLTQEHNKINKYLNANKSTLDEIYDQAFEYLMFMIQKWLDEKEGIKRQSGKKDKIDTILKRDEVMGELADESLEEFDPERIPKDKPIYIS